MIVKNEQAVLGRCLESVCGIVDEIIIVDTGSTDGTRSIAERFTDRVYDFKWIDDFAAARNFSFSKATKDFIMWLDADDVIDEENRVKLLELKENLNEKTDVVMMKYNVGSGLSYYRERILRRAMNFKWQGAVHEVITPRGNIVYSDATVLHKKLKVNDPDRNLNIFKKLIREGKPLDTRQKFYYARELYYHADYREAVQAFEDFFARPDRWMENSINACLDLSRCFTALGREEDALCSLFKSFLYDAPRAEICCEIGSLKLKTQKYREAVFWYETALRCDPQTEKGGFSSADCLGYLPCIQLCVCYDRLGEYLKAFEYNEKAGAFKPEDPIYLSNKSYFNQKFKNNF